jgi:hypothetical protein
MVNNAGQAMGMTTAGFDQRAGFRISIAELAVAVGALLVLDIYAIRFVAAEHTLYRADLLAYWSYCSGLAAQLASDPWSAIKSVAYSVAQSDLNLLPSAPLALVMAVFGDSRLAYLLSIINIYGLAVIAALLVALRRITPGTQTPSPAAVAAAALGALLLLPTLVRPVFLGYLGLGGVALGIVILALYLKGEAEQSSWRLLLLIGFLVGFLVLFRRWYAFWSIAFCLIVVVDAVWALVRSGSRDRKSVLEAVRAPAVIGLSALATQLVLAAPITLRRLAPGYAEEFVAFTHHRDLLGRLKAAIGEFGVLPIALIAASAVVLARRPATRRIGVLLPLHIVATWALMVRLQDHSEHHWYLYSAATLLLLGFAMLRLPEMVGGERRAVSLTVGILAVGLVVWAGVYLPTWAPVADALGPVVPGARVRPQQRGDLAEVQRLLALLDERTADRQVPIYVIGCSGTLSDQTLAFANRSLGTEYRSVEAILSSSSIDRRDGFPRGLLQAVYVVVPQPAQINMRPEDQQVVLLPTRSFADGTDIALAFRRLEEEFLFEGGVRVSVFERVRSHLASEVDEFSGKLRERYPDRPDIYAP